jgi:hypothetical protein
VLEVADPPLAAGAPLDQPPESAGVLGGLAGSARLALAGDRHLLHASRVQILVDCGLAVAAVGGHRLAVGPDYCDQDLVFAEPDGTPIHPDKFRKRFEVRIGRSGLTPIRFHDLRHLRHPGPAGRRPPQGRRRGPRPRQHLDHPRHLHHAIPAMQESAAATIARLVFGS